MENNSGFSELFLFEYAAFTPPPWQLVSSSILAGRTINAANGRHLLPCVLLRSLTADSSFLLLLLIAQVRSCKRPRLGGMLIGLNDSCARHRDNRANSPRRACKHTR